MQGILETLQQVPPIYSVRVDSSGRIVLPAEIRSRLHIEPGAELIVSEESDGLKVKSYEQVLRELQTYYQSLVKPGELVSEQLLQERRQAATREWSGMDTYD